MERKQFYHLLLKIQGLLFFLVGASFGQSSTHSYVNADSIVGVKQKAVATENGIAINAINSTVNINYNSTPNQQSINRKLQQQYQSIDFRLKILEDNNKAIEHVKNEAKQPQVTQQIINVLKNIEKGEVRPLIRTKCCANSKPESSICAIGL